MKQLLYTLLVAVGLLVIAGIFAKLDGQDVLPDSLQRTAQGDPLTGSADYTVSPSETTAIWMSSKPLLKDYSHTGSIAVNSGSISVVEGSVTKGTVVFDMNSLAITQNSAGAAQDDTALIKHLKSGDFFDVAKYPTATFVMSTTTKRVGEGVAGNDYLVKGILTLKGIAQPIEVPVTMTLVDGNLHIDGSIDVDRTKWGIKYASGQFFKDLGDKLIDDTFNLQFSIVAKPPYSPTAGLTTGTTTPPSTSN